MSQVNEHRLVGYSAGMPVLARLVSAPRIARDRRSLLSRLAMVVFATLVLFSTFNGAARYFLETSGLGLVVYVPAMLLFVSVLVLLFTQLKRRRMPRKDIGLWALLLASFIVGLVYVGNASQTAFGLYVLLPFIFGFCYANLLQARLAFIKRLMLLAWIFSIIGLALDYFTEVPWRGFGYQIGKFQVEGNRDWTTFGIRRLSGFSRASFELASILLMSALFTMFHLHSRAMRCVLWLVTGFAIFLTTSKGVLLAMIVLSLVYGIRRAGMRKLIGWLVIVAVLAVVVLPLTAGLYSGSDLGLGLEDDFLLQSMGARFAQMWPDAFEHAHEVGNPLWGAGLGSIGVPLTYFSDRFQNSADNIFVYLYCLIGVFSLPLMFYVAVIAKRFVAASRYQGSDDFLVLQALLGCLIYGVTTNVVESSALGLVFGFCLGAMLLIRSSHGVSHNE